MKQLTLLLLVTICALAQTYSVSATAERNAQTGTAAYLSEKESGWRFGASWLRTVHEGEPSQFGGLTIGYQWAHEFEESGNKLVGGAAVGPLASIAGDGSNGAIVELWGGWERRTDGFSTRYQRLQSRDSSITVGNPGFEYTHHLYGKWSATGETGYLCFGSMCEVGIGGGAKYERKISKRIALSGSALYMRTVFDGFPAAESEQIAKPPKNGAKIAMGFIW